MSVASLRIRIAAIDTPETYKTHLKAEKPKSKTNCGNPLQGKS